MSAELIIQLIINALSVVAPLLAHHNGPNTPEAVMLARSIQAFQEAHGTGTDTKPTT